MNAEDEQELMALLALVAARKPHHEVVYRLMRQRDLMLEAMIKRHSPIKYALRTTMMSTLDVMLHRANSEEKERVRALTALMLMKMSNASEKLVKNEIGFFNKRVNAKANAILRYSTSAAIDIIGMSNLFLQWVTQRDEQVCSLCKKFDGQIYMAHEVPELPFHGGCRCGVIPVISYLPVSNEKLLKDGLM